MERRQFLRALSGGALALAAAGGAAEERRPNVIVIVSDDAGYVDFGCYGGKQIPTPQIDALARDGVRLTAGYVTASVCCPSRAGLLTGRYQQRFGHEFNGPSKPEVGFTQDDMGLDPAEKTLGDVMRARGYRTLAVGKWHMGAAPQFHPLQRGFDEFYGFLGGSRSYFPIKGGASVSQALQRDRHVALETNITYLTDDLTQAAVSFIEREKARPFFIYLAYNAVHTPMHGKAEALERFEKIADKQRRIYAAMTASLDEGVGRVRETLKRLGLERDTLIVFINDNGGATNNGSDNGPLRGMKGSKWEGGIRVPFTLTWPGCLPAGKDYDHPVSALDVLPTCLTAAGGGEGGGKPLDGVDLFPYLLGENLDAPHDFLFWRRGVAAAVRLGQWKLIRSEGNPLLLFNLDRDPGEKTNLTQQRPETAKRMVEALEKWEQGLAPPKWREGKLWSDNQRKKHRIGVVGRELERKLP